MNYQYNEIEYAKYIEKNGFQGKYIRKQLKLLALYYRDELKLTPKERTEKLYKFCEVNFEEYNKVLHYKIIDSALAYAENKNNKPIIIESIDIYKNEVDNINSLDMSNDYKKVLFSFLVQKKLDKIIYKLRQDEDSTSNRHRGNSYKYRNIKKNACVNNKTDINLVIYELNRLGLVEVGNQGRVNFKLFDDYHMNDEIVICIKNHELSGLYFDYYNEIEKIELCEVCKEPFRKLNNRNIYCKNCSQYKKLETKTIKCVDCGEDVIIDSLANKQERCIDCQNKINTIKTKERVKKYRQKEKCNDSNFN